MGFPISPTLAILLMHKLETRFLETQKHKPILQYIDDIFVLWDVYTVSPLKSVTCTSSGQFGVLL